MIDALYRISPTPKKVRDGKGRTLEVILEHRIGAEGGCFTIDELWQEAKLGTDFEVVKRKALKRFEKDPDLASDIISAHRNRLMRRLQDAIKAWRKYLNDLYKSQGVEVCAEWVDDAKKGKVIFIQGLVDTETMTPVYGDFEDVYLMAKSVYQSTKGAADKNQKARQIAHQAMALPNVNKDLRERFRLIAKGEETLRIEHQGDEAK